MLSLYSISSAKVQLFHENYLFSPLKMFVYVYVISLYIHVLLCGNEPIDEDKMIIHQLMFFCIIDHFYFHHVY